MEKHIKQKSNHVKKTILLVDDELENIRSLGEFLVRSGYDVKSAPDAKTGWEIYRKFKPDLVLTDYRMPGMDGIELLKKIREDDKITPIVMLTGYGSAEAYLTALSAGVDEWINKPIRFKELTRLLEMVFTEDETSRLKKQNKYLQEIVIKLKEDLARCRKNKESEIVLDKYKTIIAATGHSLKSEFMHIGSSIKSLRQMTSNSPSDIIEEYEMVERSIQYSQLLLRRLLNFLDMGKPGIEKVEVAKLIQNIVSLVRPRLSSNMHLEVIFGHDVEGHVIKANYEQLMEVLVELIQNAINALREKGGTIELRLEKRNDETALSVKDDGPGIPKELVNELFVKEVKSKHGLGLGLFLCFKIVGDMGGKLHLETTSEKGTTITLLMPTVVNNKES